MALSTSTGCGDWAPRLALSTGPEERRDDVPASGVEQLMSSSVVIVGENELPRPERDASCCPGLVSGYHEARRGYHIVRRGGTSTSYLVYSVSGLGFFRDARDRAIQLGPGDLALLPTRTYQEYGTSPNGTHWACHWVHFDVQPHWWLWIPLSKRVAVTGLSVAHVAPPTQQELSRLFFMLHAERRRGDIWSTAIALNLLERILILARTNAEGDTNVVLDSRIARVLEAIELASPRAPSSAELGRIAGLSASRLARVFKAQTGTSILTAVNRVRLRAAQRALQDSPSTLQAVAERCGFSGPYSFSNWYLKQTGLRPSEYRRRCAHGELAKHQRDRDGDGNVQGVSAGLAVD